MKFAKLFVTAITLFTSLSVYAQGLTELSAVEKLYTEKNYEQAYQRASQLAFGLSQQIGSNGVVAKARADISRRFEQKITRESSLNLKMLEPAYSMKGKALDVALTHTFQWESQDTRWFLVNAHEVAEAVVNRDETVEQIKEQLAKHVVDNAENILVLKAATIWAIRSGIEVRRLQEVQAPDYAELKKVAKVGTMLRFAGQVTTIDCETRTTARRKSERNEWIGVSFIIPFTVKSSSTVEERPSITQQDCTAFKEILVKDSLDSVYVSALASLDRVIDAWLELAHRAELFEGWSKNLVPGFGNPYLGK